MAGKWPKTLAPLTEEQKRISDEFMRLWHEVLPKRYGMIEHFNHRYPLRTLLKQDVGGKKLTTLEIGAGIGGHLPYESLEQQDYYAVELREDMAHILKEQFPACHVVLGDCQKQLDFPAQFFDRILAIHVLEHLPNLPETIKEVHRLLKPSGHFMVVIPCEGGFAYRMARNISARRLFEKRFKQSYDWFIQNEHINMPAEIFDELEPYFVIRNRRFFPLRVHSIEMNLCIGLTLIPRVL